MFTVIIVLDIIRQNKTEPKQENQEAVKRSALWAAYGDVLGYLAELTDEKGRKWRVGTTRITTTIPWKRRIGGKFGVVVELLAGCYSDDTQLRLATCRAIQGDGKLVPTKQCRFGNTALSCFVNA